MNPLSIVDIIVVPAIIVAIAFAVRGSKRPRLDRVTAWLDGGWAPVVLGAITALTILFVWGSLNQVGVIHDERAYVLQARLFASGRWSAPSPPYPEFFEQLLVLVVPRLAAKYPPGHSMLLVPGVWLGLTGLVPVLLGGLTGGLAFALARRASNTWVALLTWLLCTTASDGLRWRASYFSETTTAAALLVAWWALLEWRRTKRVSMLVVVALAIGWGAITRPLTMLALAIPIGAVVLRDTARRRAWRGLAVALLAGCLVLAVLPLWSARTTGSWRESPLSLWTRQYLPFDVPGFGFDSTPPRRPLPNDLAVYAKEFGAIHARYHPADVPRAIVERSVYVVKGMWSGWQAGFVLLVVVGAAGAPLEGTFALVSAALLFAAYLSYAHPPFWTLYYLEAQPVLAFLAALGTWRVMRLVLRRDPASSTAVFGATPALERGTLALIAVLAVLTSAGVRDVRALTARRTFTERQFRDALAMIPEPRSIVFVRYAPTHNALASLVLNTPDLGAARTWVVYDRGAADTLLMRLAPDRAAYLYDEQSHTFTRVVLSR